MTKDFKSNEVQIDDGTLSFFELLKLIWRNKTVVAGFMATTFVCGVLYIALTANAYYSFFELSPIKDPESDKISNTLSMLSSETKFSFKRAELGNFTHLLTSSVVADELVKDDRIVKTIFHSEWDSKTGTWHAPRNIKQFVKAIVYGAFNIPTYSPPSAYRLGEYLNATVKVDAIPSSDLYVVSTVGTDREFSEYLLEKIYKISDHIMRSNNINTTRKSVEHIKNKIAGIDSLVHQRSLFGLLVFYEQQLIMLETDQPFAATKFGPVMSSDLPVSPRVPVVFIISLAIGFVLSIGWILLKHQDSRKAVLQGLTNIKFEKKSRPSSVDTLEM